ncbi:MAG: hypothetical protein QM765_14360 [Myxococcales bacterium]
MPLLLAFSLLAGCATTHPAPFFCESPPAHTAEPPHRRTDGPAGELTLQLLEPRLARPETAPEPSREPGDGLRWHKRAWYAEQKLRAVANSVPLQSIASSLSSALGIRVALEPALADARVFVFHPETTVDEFLDAVERQASVHVDYEHDGLRIESFESWEAYRASTLSVEPTRIRLMRMKGGYSAEQLAQIYCRNFASSRGSATAVEDLLIVRDTLDGLARIEGLKDRMENPLYAPSASKPPEAKAEAGRE